MQYTSHNYHTTPDASIKTAFESLQESPDHFPQFVSIPNPSGETQTIYTLENGNNLDQARLRKIGTIEDETFLPC